METNITRIDEHEARVDFDGSIWISYEQKSEFEKELAQLIDRYAI